MMSNFDIYHTEMIFGYHIPFKMCHKNYYFFVFFFPCSIFGNFFFFFFVKGLLSELYLLRLPLRDGVFRFIVSWNVRRRCKMPRRELLFYILKRQSTLVRISACSPSIRRARELISFSLRAVKFQPTRYLRFFFFNISTSFSHSPSSHYFFPLSLIQRAIFCFYVFSLVSNKALLLCWCITNIYFCFFLF
jgi:hypothetical protein